MYLDYINPLKTQTGSHYITTTSPHFGRILKPLAFNKISALYFTPFTVKYFADAIPSSVIPRVCFTRQVPDPRLSAMQSSQGRYFCSCIYPAPTQCIMQHQREPCVRATPSRHVAWSRPLFFEYFPRSLSLHAEHGSWVNHPMAEQSPWLTRSVTH